MADPRQTLLAFVKTAATSRRLESAIHSASCIAVVTDPTGALLFFNDAAEALTGYTREEVLGRNLLNLFVPVDWIETVLKRFSDPFSPILRLPHSNPWIRKDGRRVIVEWCCGSVSLREYQAPCIVGAGLAVPQVSEGHAALL